MKVELVCYFCRKKFAEVQISGKKLQPIAYDFCPGCEAKALESFELQLYPHYRYLPTRPFLVKKVNLVEGE